MPTSRSVTLNLKDETDRKPAWRLVETADVMIGEFPFRRDRPHGISASRKSLCVIRASCSARRAALGAKAKWLDCRAPIRISKPFPGLPPLMADTEGGERVRYYGMLDLYCGPAYL